VDAEQRVITVLEQIERACAERIVWPAGHAVRPLGLLGTPRNHFLRWGPGRPHHFAPDIGESGPAKAVAADRTAIADRLLIGQDEIKLPVGRVDDDCPWSMTTSIRHDRFAIGWPQF